LYVFIFSIRKEKRKQIALTEFKSGSSIQLLFLTLTLYILYVVVAFNQPWSDT